MSATTCPHFEKLPFAKVDPNSFEDPLMVKLRKKLESEKGCQVCGKSTKASYICLNPDCLFIGCGRENKRHALEHYRLKHKPEEERLHGFALNTLAFQCWCYECDDVISPPLFASLESEEGAPTISSVASTGSRRKSIKTLPFELPLGVGFFQECEAFIYRQHNRRITESFHKLIETIFTLNMQVVSPSRLVREVKLINPLFHGYTQQDTMDFFRCVLERIHDETKVQLANFSPANSKMTLNKGESPENVQRRRSERIAKLEQKTLNVSKLKDQPQFRSIISDTFGGVLRSEIYCLDCSSVSVKDDPFYDVSVQICSSPEGPKGSSKSSLAYIGNFLNSIGETMGLNGKPVKLETCLAAFCAPEILEGKDRYKCEKCNRLVDSKKTLKFKELPQVLCIQLKRFRHESYFSSKIGTHVVFPIDNIDMAPYLHESASDFTKGETRYYLSSIISHRGTFGGGHYLSYCRKVTTGQWIEFDDSSVTVVSEEEVSKVQAYALFYSLVDWSIRKERKEWLPRITVPMGGEPNHDDSGGVYISKLWYNRWCTMANPGPLDNSEVVCLHGKLAPEKVIKPLELLQHVPKNAYDYFVSKYGECSGIDPLWETSSCEQCAEEERELDLRRKREEKDIQSLDTSSIKSGECWYLVNSEWLIQWGQFKSGFSPPPGPISNETLISKDNHHGGEPRSNLIRGTHYRGVNRRVWEYFYQIYGGGPTIIRKSINIYGPVIQSNDENDRPKVVLLDDDTTLPDDAYVDVLGH